jgi:hypothetical protein
MNNAGGLDSGHGIEDITVDEFNDIMALMLSLTKSLYRQRFPLRRC